MKESWAKEKLAGALEADGCSLYHRGTVNREMARLVLPFRTKQRLQGWQGTGIIWPPSCSTSWRGLFCLVMEAVKTMLYRRTHFTCWEKHMYNTLYVIAQIQKSSRVISLSCIFSQVWTEREGSSFIFNPRSWKNKSPGGKRRGFHFVVCFSLKAKDLKVFQLCDFSLLYTEQTRLYKKRKPFHGVVGLW